MRKTGEHGQTHTGQILRKSNQNGESLIEMTENDMFTQEGQLEPGPKKKVLNSKHRRVKSGASDQLQNKNVINIVSTTN